MPRSSETSGVGCGGDVRDQPRPAPDPLPNRDVGMAYRGVGMQHRRDLGGLDAESADLDLRVGAAQKLQRAVRPASHHIAGPVHPLASHERVGDEPARRLAGPAEIAASQLVAGQVELAGHAVGRGSQP